MGRPSIYSAELAASICERIALGESLRAICRDEGMPGQTTVFEWLSQDAAFAEQYARARDYQGDTMFDRVLDTAVSVEGGAMAPDALRNVEAAHVRGRRDPTVELPPQNEIREEHLAEATT